MKLNSNRIRRNFQPLNITVGMRVLSSDTLSPLTQTYDSINDEYLPDRSLVPLVLLPQISMVANDGSMNDDNGNAVPYTNADLITDGGMMNWYVGDKTIGEVFDVSEYSIETRGTYDASLGVNTRGMLTITKNIPEGQSLSIYFEGYVLDRRTGQKTRVATKPEVIRTVAIGEDKYHIVVDSPKVFLYNPFFDRLLLHQWKKAHGMDVGSDTEASVTDDYSYLHTWNLRLKAGENVLGESQYTLKLLDPNDNNAVISDTPLNGVVEFTNTHLTIDARMFRSRDYKVAAYIEHKSDGTLRKVEEQVLTAKFTKPRYFAEVQNTNDTNPTDEYHANSVAIYTKAKRQSGTGVSQRFKLEYPDAYFNFLWYAVTGDGEEHLVGETSSTVYSLADIAVGNTYADSEYNEEVYGDLRPVLTVAQDDDNNTYVDGDGDILAFED